MQLAQALSLPQDGLSAALIAFARHFTLPLDPALLLKLRGEALANPRAGKNEREAATLAAVAAADKGVQLTPEALNRYATAIEGEGRHSRDSGGNSPDGRGTNNGGEPDSDGSGSSRGDEPGSDNPSSGRRREEAAAAETEGTGGKNEAPRKITGRFNRANLNSQLEQLETGDPLIHLLNRLPGQNGGFWQVYPLNYTVGGIEFHVAVRILLEDTGTTAKKVARIAVDVTGGERQWHFTLDKPGGPEVEMVVSITPPPPPGLQNQWEGEIRKLLGTKGPLGPQGPLEVPVTLKTGEGEAPFMDSKKERLPSINEAV
ncbi:hypothetical protein FACS189483_10180 [Spirochaetia bacterium]|nr:hypothetical protein FACS189483_10180 [Spirochaetia bacterium]